MPPRKRKLSKPKRSARKKSSTPRPSVASAFEKLVAVMHRLRAPGGCPWDREQTHATLRTFLIEEAYEVLDALDGADDAKFAEELGDLLLQVLFHSEIAHEEGRFSIEDVIREIHEKLIRRHPHVFGEKQAKDAAEVLRNWEQIKKAERQSKRSGETRSAAPSGRHLEAAVSADAGSTREPESLLDGVPRTLPALLEAYQLTRKAARIGFDWKNIEGIFAKLREETAELRQVLSQPPVTHREFAHRSESEGEGGSSSPAGYSSTHHSHRIEGEVGDILFVAVNLARFLNVDPEIAMKKTNAKFSARFREMERLAREKSTTLAEVPRPQLESLWEEAKRREQAMPARKVAP